MAWDVKSGKVRLTFLAHPDNEDSAFRSSPTLAWSPDDKGLVTASTDRTIRWWDAAAGREMGRMAAPSRCYSVAFSKEGKVLMTGQADSSALLWDAEFLPTARPMGRRNFSIGHIDQR
jgi:WD40 repeat protein